LTEFPSAPTAGTQGLIDDLEAILVDPLFIVFFECLLVDRNFITD